MTAKSSLVRATTVIVAIPGLVWVPVYNLPLRDERPPSVHADLATRLVAYQAPVSGAVARFFDPPAQRWLAGHRGVDFWLAPGAQIASPATGVVTFAGTVAGKPLVVVTHPDGLRSTLEPVTASVRQGTTVTGGEAVGMLATWPGTQGNDDHCVALTPQAAGACLHWGVRRGDTYLDPLALLGTAPPIVLLPPR
ncbi:MAG: M23 family metallopeptidase [Promicromonosporaceae bacterium]|nr:M23 family metallopeptidase [Promicromonosporaceae bacterium]